MKILSRIKSQYGDDILNASYFLGQLTLEINKNCLLNLLSELKNPCGFRVLMDLTAVDYLQPSIGTKLIYWLHNPDTGERTRLKVFLCRDEFIPSVSALWAGAKWYEREIFDLFGVKFENHVDLKRLLMPDDWLGHPLRKDYCLTEERVEFKQGVSPKVPSETIHVCPRQKLLPP